MQKRLRIEVEILEKHFPNFRLLNANDDSSVGLVGQMISNGGQSYLLWLPIDSFPECAPSVYIVSPVSLKDHAGQLLVSLGANPKMHLLQADRHGHPQISHYNGRFWRPNVTLYKVLMKARMWVEAYELHLVNGRMIDDLLRVPTGDTTSISNQ